MTRRDWMVLTLVWSACGRPVRPAGSLLPPSVDAVWQRKSLHDMPPPQPAILRAFEAAYDGPGKLTVDLYEAKASGTAFEMTQHWRASADTVFFDKGRYFVVVKWERADRQALRGFVRALEKELGDLAG